MSQISKIIQQLDGRTPVIIGPTASGKTTLSIQMADRIGGEIISVDSRQIYRGFRIGTAQPTQVQLEFIPHHLIDVLPPDSRISSGKYAEWVRKHEKKIISMGKTPVLTGGSFLYVQSVIAGIIQQADSNPEKRDHYYKLLEVEGIEKTIDKIRRIDPEYASIIHRNDRKRIVRVLEIMDITGKPPSKLYHLQQQQDRRRRYQYYIISIIIPRELLYTRINERTVRMIKNGWLDEVKELLDSGVLQESHPMQSLGYRQLCQVIKGDLTLDKAIETIQIKTRQFAKKQMTWLRKMNIDFEYILEMSK